MKFLTFFLDGANVDLFRSGIFSHLMVGGGGGVSGPKKLMG